jgi:hypothetical protein
VNTQRLRRWVIAYIQVVAFNVGSLDCIDIAFVDIGCFFFFPMQTVVILRVDLMKILSSASNRSNYFL